MGDRGEVSGGRFGQAAHFQSHRAAEDVAGRGEAGRERGLDVVFGPVFQALGRDVRRLALALRQRAASQPARGDDPTQKIAGGMAFRAMARPLNEIAAAGLLIRRIENGKASAFAGARPETGGSVRRKA